LLNRSIIFFASFGLDLL